MPSLKAHLSWPLLTAAVAVAGGLLVVRTPPILPLGLVLASCLGIGALVVSRQPEVAAPVRVRTEVTFVASLPFLAGVLTVDQLNLRPFLNFTLSDWLFLVGCLTALGASAAGARGTLARGIPAAAGLFATGAVLSSFSSATPLDSLATAGRFVVLTCAWFWLASLILTTTHRVSLAALLWGLSAGVSGAVAFVQLRYGAIIPFTVAPTGRMLGTAQHVEDLGGSAGVATPVLLWLATTRSVHRPAVRALILVSLAGAFIGVILSGSVTGMTTALAGSAAYLLAKKKVSLLIAVAIACAVGLYYITHFQSKAGAYTPTTRFHQVQEREGSLSTRFETYRVAVRSIESNPIAGRGFATNDRKTVTGFEPHNALLNVWYTGGALAVLGLGLIIFVVFRHGWRLVATSPRGSTESDLAIALMSAFGAYLVFGLAEPTVYSRFGWIPAALLLALRPARTATGR